MTSSIPSVAELTREARSWLESVARPLERGQEWGVGSDSTAVFENWTEEEERRNTDVICAWERTRFDAGWGSLGWGPEYGGRGLPSYFDEVYRQVEAGFDVPRRTEVFVVTQQLIAPTIEQWGTDEQRSRFVARLLRADTLACQLFSEPGAGSDLAGVSTRATRDGDGWLISGQKVWTSGARVCDVGEAICRTDPSAPKHAGLTAFLIPLDAPGVEIRPIRQMTGGESFSEVFLDEVRVPDSARLGPVGSGWKVALTTLMVERLGAGSLGLENADRLVELARHAPAGLTPVQRLRAADVFLRSAAQRLTALRINAAVRSGVDPGDEVSVGKLFATETMRRTSDAAHSILGNAMLRDDGSWGGFAWNEHVLGAPGYRIAGGSDEIQRNIIAERVLGLPR
jgi:alkylation response protein AidB-like acyl-CoA dehydrogenase